MFSFVLLVLVPSIPLAARGQCVDPPSGMVGWWPLDGVGPVAEEIVGNRDGVHQNGAIASVLGQVDAALSFDGVDDVVSVPSPPHVSYNSFTVDAWVRNTAVSALRSIALKGAFNPGLDGFWLYLNGGHVGFTIGDGVDQTGLDTVASVSDGAWHHLALTMDPALGWTLYLDGAALTSVSATLSGGTNSHPLLIGAVDATASPADPYLGEIDEVEVFDRALGPAEVSAIYQAGSFGKCKPALPPALCTPAPAGMVAWYPADDCQAEDIVGGNDGVEMGSGGLCPINPKVPPASLGLSGSNWFEVPDDPSLRFGVGELSIDAWVRSSAAGIQTIVDKGPGYRLDLADGQLRLIVCDDTICQIALSPQTLSNGSWHHVAGTLGRGEGGVANLSVYVDGLLRDGSSAPLGSTDFSTPLRIGSEAGGLTPFNGAIDEVEVFSGALSEAQVAALFQADRAGKCRGVPVPAFSTPLVALIPVLLLIAAGLLALRTGDPGGARRGGPRRP